MCITVFLPPKGDNQASTGQRADIDPPKADIHTPENRYDNHKTRSDVPGRRRRPRAALATTTTAATAADGDIDFIQVNMWDRGPDVMAAFDMSNRIMLGTPGAALKDDPGAPMGFTLNKHVIPRGTVKFVATNTSTFLEHEMLVFRIDDITKPLAYNTADERLDEDAAGSLGEIAETAPAKPVRGPSTSNPGSTCLPVTSPTTTRWACGR